MSRRLNLGTRGLGASPWEPQSRLLDGHEGFSDSSLRSTPARQVPDRDAQPSGAAIEACSGLTTRGVVYEYVRAHPGTHVRGIGKHLRLATGALQYHLFWLEKHGFVKTKKIGFYRFVYPAMVFKESQEVLLGVLSQETPREILLCLLQDRAFTQGDLARSLGCSQPTISWHMERILQNGLVAKEKTRKGTVYKLVACRDDVMTLTKAYHPRAWKTWESRLAHAAVAVGGKRAGKRGMSSELVGSG